MSQAPRGCGCAVASFMLFWLLGWTAGTLAFDAFILGALYQQARALTFDTTDGTVTRSAVATGRDGDGGASHRLDIAYEYQVNGRRYTGTRYSRAEMGTNSKAWHAIRDELPVGTRVRVWYDPGDPADAVLRPGLTGFHLALVWFLTPFNLIMLGGWVMLALSRRGSFDPANRRWVRPTPSGVRVPLPTAGRAGRFAGCLLGITFAGTFVLGFGFGFNPPVLVGAGGYLAAVAVSIGFAARHVNPVLEVNQLERVLRFVRAPEPVEVPFAAVRAVEVTHEETTDSEGGSTHRYHCDLTRADAPDAPLRVVTFHDAETAGRFAAWLRAEVGIDEPDA